MAANLPEESEVERATGPGSSVTVKGGEAVLSQVIRWPSILAAPGC